MDILVGLFLAREGTTMQFQPPSSPGWGQPEPEQQSFPQQTFPPQPSYQQPQFYQRLTPPQQSPQIPIPPTQQSGQFQQQQTQYPPFPQQQTQYPIPGQQLPMPPPLPRSPQKNSRRNLVIGIIVAVIVFAIIMNIGKGIGSTTTDQSTPVAQTTTTDQSTPTADQSTPTPQPTVDTPTPTLSPAQQESAYKASTTNTTVPTLDKDGNADSGNDVHFTADILNFVKDDSGNTAGANVDDPNGGSGVVQIAFPPGADISQLNVGDVIEVWGSDQGTASGQNAYGATIQEVVISALYLTDKTTGYQTN